ncbi:hypothetical protein [Marinibactrum halimedae]|uniref:Uncharacterized protein n=1 Tax=Marinibactrum halimedae TaxID=1444977 RepID=A0AA37WQS8_9GAMM|nr:hypothetical protein [Marinibactrum halimedae]MCD9458909.1 hypothetical protein [Marinibactrum halimedae]GLS27757.1 hypothetical protein GCM10007877_34760 [Marinibactrum halimedae]
MMDMILFILMMLILFYCCYFFMRLCLAIREDFKKSEKYKKDWDKAGLDVKSKLDEIFKR